MFFLWDTLPNRPVWRGRLTALYRGLDPAVLTASGLSPADVADSLEQLKLSRLCGRACRPVIFLWDTLPNRPVWRDRLTALYRRLDLAALTAFGLSPAEIVDSLVRLTLS